MGFWPGKAGVSEDIMAFFNFFSEESRFVKRLEEFSGEKVGGAMTRHVITVTPEDTLLDAANVMIGEHVSSLVIVGDNYKKPLGIITERDFLSKAPLDHDKLEKMKVGELMVKNLVTINPSLPLMETNEIMDKHGFRKLIVTEKEDLAGIITQTDLVRKLDELYRRFPFRTSDSLKVKDVMLEFPRLKPSAKIVDAQKEMVKMNTGTCFICEKDKLEGIFTEYDFLSQLAKDPEQLKKISLGDAMSFPVMALDSELDLFDANHLMLEKVSRRMPVLENGRLKGKLTQRIVRHNGYELIGKTIERARKKELKAVNFQAVKNDPLVREIHGKVQEFKYP